MTHKHKAIVLAYLAGEEVEIFDDTRKIWHPYPFLPNNTYLPAFPAQCQFRIKGKTPDYLMIYLQAAYPKYKGSWDTTKRDDMNDGVKAVIFAHEQFLREKGLLK